tara:strand:- start:5280 stop:5813 length:534 start_codon:yes stop_codon:yes gene_type:complete
LLLEHIALSSGALASVSPASNPYDFIANVTVLRLSTAMARRVSLLLSFLLAFLVIVNVEAKSKADQIRAYQFTSDYCVGDPKGANVDLQRDHCVNVDARSVKPVVDAKRLKWLSDVNNGAHSCYLMSFDSPDCPDTQNVGVTVMELPPAFNKCVTSSQPIRSVKFVCGLKMSVSASA